MLYKYLSARFAQTARPPAVKPCVSRARFDFNSDVVRVALEWLPSNVEGIIHIRRTLLLQKENRPLVSDRPDAIDEARDRLKKAFEQWEQAAVHSWEPAEPAECITKCFYAFENAVTAAMLAAGRKSTTKHYEKAGIASELVAEGFLKTDVSDRLVELNDLRKDVQYGEPGAAMMETDLEDLTTELEYFLREVQDAIDEVEEAE